MPRALAAAPMQDLKRKMSDWVARGGEPGVNNIVDVVEAGYELGGVWKGRVMTWFRKVVGTVCVREDVLSAVVGCAKEQLNEMLECILVHIQEEISLRCDVEPHHLECLHALACTIQSQPWSYVATFINKADAVHESFFNEGVKGYSYLSAALITAVWAATSEWKARAKLLELIYNRSKRLPADSYLCFIKSCLKQLAKYSEVVAKHSDAACEGTGHMGIDVLFIQNLVHRVERHQSDDTDGALISQSPQSYSFQSSYAE